MEKQNPLPTFVVKEKLSANPDAETTGSAMGSVIPVSYASKNFKRKRRISDRIKPIVDRVLKSENIKPILLKLTENIQKAFNCGQATLYALDRANRQIYSRNLKRDDAEEIRLDVDAKSLAGYVASTGKSLNIADVYDKDELATYQPTPIFDSSWDKKTKFKTKSALIVPLPHNRKLMGVLAILNRQGDDRFTREDLLLAKELASTLGLAILKMEIEDFQEKLTETSHAIHSATSVDEILIKFKDPILQLFDASLVTIYAVDFHKNEIYSKVKSGDTLTEIRVPISPNSIAGWVALGKSMLNITDVYDRDELRKYGPNLSFDSTWDKKFGIKTKTMLVHPLLHENKLMGALQLVNKRGEERFTSSDEKNIQIVCSTLALAFFNQQKLAQAKTSKFSYLQVRGIITEEELTKATARSRKKNVSVENILLDNLGLRREDVGKSLEHFYKVPYFGFSDSFILESSLFSGLNKDFLINNRWVPLQSDQDKVVILTNDPDDTDMLQGIKINFPKKKIELKVGLKADILDYLNSSIDESDSEEEEVAQTEEMSSILEGLLDEKGEPRQTETEQEDVSMFNEKNSGIVRLVNKVITDAYTQGISDIHIEPGIGKKNMRVRFRKDGECRVYQEIPFHYKQAFISRLKIMSRLNIAEKRLPQDGKIKMKYGRHELELRVATCPTVGGNEDVVMRILASSKPIPLGQMNFSKRNLELTRACIAKPYGLILVVGPTGSGKTTTLHSVLGVINTPERKIWTAEDPVEITQEGLRQVQVQNKIGLDFACAMRSFLRGDPDVIMVGEMRDAETCAIGLEASLTGHLVLSTLHTNSAPETITRLIDMGMNPINFADALLLIIAQRLVRTLCKFCKQPYQPNVEEFDSMVEEFGEERFSNLGIQFSDYLTLYRAVGCIRCNHSGYSGRTGLHEVLEGTEEIKRMIMQKAFVEDIRKRAMKDGMTTLKQDGISKVFKGDCDIKQVMAICTI